MERGYHSTDRNGNPRKGKDMDKLLDKIDDLKNATSREDGTMSAQDKGKLDSLEDDEEMSIEEIAAILNF